jgi:hypothetical protein
MDMSRDQQLHACELGRRCSSKLHSSSVQVELSNMFKNCLFFVGELSNVIYVFEHHHIAV